jgi:lipoate-protein ligase A
MHQSLRAERLSAAAQLSNDWQLFRLVEAGASRHAFRMWETEQPVVILGRSNVVAAHVIEAPCHDDGVPVIRRFTGGGSVVLGRGCLNYAVAVSLVSRPELRDVGHSFAVILDRIVTTLDVPGVSVAGGTDLAIAGRKISGNAQRRGRDTLLHHGTLLYGFDPALAARYLREPPRQPSYRAARPHADFLGNVPLARDDVRARVACALASLAH